MLRLQSPTHIQRHHGLKLSPFLGILDTFDGTIQKFVVVLNLKTHHDYCTQHEITIVELNLPENTT